MQERALTRALSPWQKSQRLGPAVVAVERDWGLAITPFEIVLLSAVVAATFIAVEHLHQLALYEGMQ